MDALLHRCCWLRLGEREIRQETLYEIQGDDKLNLLKQLHNLFSKKRFRLRHYLILLYIPTLILSGVMFDPYMAILLSLFYEGGFIGLIMIYISPKQDKNEMQWGYLALGITILICCYVWIEFIWSRSVPY